MSNAVGNRKSTADAGVLSGSTAFLLRWVSWRMAAEVSVKVVLLMAEACNVTVPKIIKDLIQILAQ